MRIELPRTVRLLLVASTVFSFALARSDATEPRQVARPSPAQIDKWITQLNAQNYATREFACLALIKCGRAAVLPAADAAHDDSAEVRHRAFHILVQLFESSDKQTSSAAQKELLALAEYGHPGVRETLEGRAAVAIRAVQARLESEGVEDRQIATHICAAVERIPRPAGRVVGVSLTVEEDLGCGCCYGSVRSQLSDRDFRHVAFLNRLTKLHVDMAEITDEGLAQLVPLENLQELDISSNRITDAGLKHLMDLRNLRKLDIGGTGLTEDGIAVLESALPNCQIRYYKALR